MLPTINPSLACATRLTRRCPGSGVRPVALSNQTGENQVVSISPVSPPTPWRRGATSGRPLKRETTFDGADLWRCRFEQFRDRLRSDRLAEVITLHFVAIVLAQKRHLIVGLDALGDDPQIQLLAQ